MTSRTVWDNFNKSNCASFVAYRHSDGFYSAYIGDVSYGFSSARYPKLREAFHAALTAYLNYYNERG